MCIKQNVNCTRQWALYVITMCTHIHAHTYTYLLGNVYACERECEWEWALKSVAYFAARVIKIASFLLHFALSSAEK